MLRRLSVMRITSYCLPSWLVSNLPAPYFPLSHNPHFSLFHPPLTRLGDPPPSRPTSFPTVLPVSLTTSPCPSSCGPTTTPSQHTDQPRVGVSAASVPCLSSSRDTRLLDSGCPVQLGPRTSTRPPLPHLPSFPLSFIRICCSAEVRG